MDFGLENHRTLIGKKVSDLPSPSLVLSLPVIKRNVEKLHQDVEKAGVAFRPHVKTLKTTEVTRLMLGNGKFNKTVASTLSEIRGLLPLAKEGILEEVLYGLPVSSGVIPLLSEYRKSVKILLMVDHEKQIDLLEESANKSADAQAPWDIFIKLDVGSKRAGVPLSSERLQKLIQRANESSVVSLYGFYCHAGHSYGCKTQEEAAGVLADEVNGVISAAKLIVGEQQLTLSVGATPTAHVVCTLQTAIPSNVTLELHAGNFPTNDLQQVATGLVSIEDQAVRITAEVCSVYPERNEALINAGTVALSKEAGAFPGFGNPVGKPGWAIVRMSQEHGIIGEVQAPGSKNAEPERRDIEADFEIGEKLTLYVQHSCITAAAFHVYYVVDENDVVQDTWVPWKGW
ncbi:D-serine dehydratase [Colletotrichum siamense]|uniref:D-serine dehydratase n=1 Tax=Colletotrichum siamense TaxID=690259 RepID=A0A9P5EQK5_COLSI|nr:D-serine dehydratase [Colletotrichum siamense]KAF4857677.1 D-serine dehydratase [Colletotrichum siamense]